jgi:hypothetical protein
MPPLIIPPIRPEIRRDALKKGLASNMGGQPFSLSGIARVPPPESSWWVPMPDLKGQTIFIIGGGPSVPVDIISRLPRTLNFIAINQSWKIRPTANYHYFCDSFWWERFGRDALAAGVWNFATIADIRAPYVRRLKSTYKSGLCTTPGYLSHGRDSGHQAINLAFHLGVKRIVLVGYDLGIAPTGEYRWHSDYADRAKDVYEKDLAVMRGPYPALAEGLRAAGVEVINTATRSALECFPKAELTGVLENVLDSTSNVR